MLILCCVMKQHHKCFICACQCSATVLCIVLLILTKVFLLMPAIKTTKRKHTCSLFCAPVRAKVIFQKDTSPVMHLPRCSGWRCAQGQNNAVPSTQSVVFAGAAGLQCVPSRCPAGWPAAPSSPSVTQENNKQQVCH